ncbi:MAG TPA: DinB family protein [Gemmatimonadaceae bacterium]|nr:DinB family protein [Gemmatimonadaceae bacterium]
MSRPEVWLRGAVPHVPALLQPVAHSLLQCREEIRAALSGLSNAHLVSRPGNAASVGYHARHAMGSLDRLFTYARGEQLSDAQRATLAAEADQTQPADAAELIAAFDAAVERALAQLRSTAEATLLEPREVGRARLPSTVLGLLFHAAEHTQRHVGQLVTTAKVVRERT